MGIYRARSSAFFVVLLFCATAVAQSVDSITVCRSPSNISTDSGIGILSNPSCVTKNDSCVDDQCQLCQLFRTVFSVALIPCTAPTKLPEPVPVVPDPPLIIPPGFPTLPVAANPPAAPSPPEPDPPASASSVLAALICNESTTASQTFNDLDLVTDLACNVDEASRPISCQSSVCRLYKLKPRNES